ncbi:hypothetical protein LB503_010700 [Fusarium chuoi]|nr:hypothetical protein LB503_010700 [Fusarium chuoi]
MEAVGVAVSFLELITPLLEAALLLRRYVKGREGLLDRKKWKESVRLGPDGTIYLGGWQIALEGEFRWQCLRGDENPQDDAGETMDNDPPQGDHGIRLEPIEEGSHGYGDAFPLATGPCSFLRNGSKPSRTHGIISPYTRLCSPSRSGDTSRYLKKAKKDAIGKELKLLDAPYIKVRSKDNWKKLFLLQFHHACLRLFFDFLTALEVDEKEHADDSNTDYGFAELWQWNLKTITQRSYEYRDLREMARKLISTTESLIDVVRSSPHVVNSTSCTNKFMAIEMEIRGLCREANERVQSLSDQLDHDLKYLELARDINQTKGVQQLTLLATIFLPLSLASGLLSMQTRFKDLGTLLYDFFGVVMLLAAIVIIIMILLNLMTVVNEVDSKLGVRSSGYRENIRGKVLFTINAGFCAFGCLDATRKMSNLPDILLHSVLCEDYAPERPLNREDRPDLELPASQFEGIVNLLRNRGHSTHEAWARCLATLEAVEEGDAEPGIFPVLDAIEDAFREVVTDLKEISRLSDEAKEDVSILIQPELDVRVVRTFRNDLIKADEILLGRAKDDKGEPIERFVGVGKLCGEVLPQLEAFLKVQNNAEIVLLMILEIIKAQRLVEEHGEGQWLQPLKDILGEDLYEQILEAGAA